MKHETPTIPAERRERHGTRYAQRLRKAGRLPGVIYGHKAPPVSVSVDETTLINLLRHGAHAMYLDIEGGKTETCLVKDLQFGYLGDNVIHVDFARVALDEEVTVNVNLQFVGTPEEATKSDAILRHDLTELSVTCAVQAIPEDIRVDLTKMEGTQLHAGDVPLPAGLELAEDPQAIVASVSFLRVEEEPVGEEVEVPGDVAEPEVITEAKAEDGEADAK